VEWRGRTRPAARRTDATQGEALIFAENRLSFLFVLSSIFHVFIEKPAFMPDASLNELLSPTLLSRIADYALLARLAVEGYMSGLHRSTTKGYGSEFEQYRSYSSGDDLKYIDWKLFARSGKLYAKVFQEETSMRCAVLLDASASMAYQGQGAACSKYRYAAMLAACFTYLAQRQGDQLGLFIYADEMLYATARGQREGQLRQSAAHLSRVQPAGVAYHDAAMVQAENYLGRRGLLIWLSDFHGAEDSLTRQLRRLRAAQRDGLLCQILDRDEIDLPFTDTLRFVDSENGDEITTAPGEVCTDYQLRMQGFMDAVRQDCLNNNSDYLLSATDGNLAELLSAYLHRREALL
jgi:uncharacterized protein (DUF58 family)